jgi:hypothetical protein
MPFASVLLLATLLPAAGASQPADVQPSASPQQPQAQSTFVASTDSASSADVFDSDDVCYKIRAYIFKRDDDHAPQFVRSTTCGPRKPHTKAADWPKAKLVPAN